MIDPRDDSRYVWLDAIRAACAIAVCAGHLRAATLVDHASLDTPSALSKLFYLSTGLGHQAVIVFFVLSGFFVGGAALRRADAFDPTRYAIARLTRLWIVLIPALAATALIDLVIATRAPDVLAGAYASTWNSGPMPATPYAGDAITFLANVFFLQTVVAPVYGTNAPLWSLANEFW